jgi:hypothetical protein
MRRALIIWGVGFALLIAAFAITVATLNGTLYSAHGFVQSYLDALARHDSTTAEQLPGVRPPAGATTELLTDDALGAIDGIHLERDASNSRGVHTVSFGYLLGGKRASSDFRVRQTGTFLGLFSQWTFQTSPLATVSVAVLHDPRFLVNGQSVTSPAKHSAASPYLVFAPGLYRFDHKSTYLMADAVDAPVTDPGSVTPVQIDVEANTAFVTEVRKELQQYLDKCATQHVLLPTSCPFGKTFDNRVDSTPDWAMKRYPAITIIPDHDSGKWLVPNTTAAAHLKVKVQSLFDGSVSTYDKDVSFEVSYSITVGDDNQLTITSLYD